MNFWLHCKLMDTVGLRAQEHDVKAFEIIEHDASKYIAASVRRGRSGDTVKGRVEVMLRTTRIMANRQWSTEG